MVNPLYHAELAKKLKTLYQSQLNPNINNNAELARELGVSRQAISKWIRGTETSPGNRLPQNKVSPLARLFDIPVDWLTLPLEAFIENVSRKTEVEQRHRHSQILDFVLTTQSNAGRQGVDFAAHDYSSFNKATLARALHHALKGNRFDETRAICLELISREGAELVASTLMEMQQSGQGNFVELLLEFNHGQST